ncbi:hypothetical protein GP486_006056 [Trichoglossum hirsutum]|uniref:NACHT domain-containing protein n=1 Tax=Trichoglossum hirsutum TaxID=265104 RepID=A0A9P8L819_9PEZI|nr:hypothetical protein GP486_006056 [Trichoglossum hirsutum]
MRKREFELGNNQGAILSTEKRGEIYCDDDDARTPVANVPGPGLAHVDYTVGWICAITTEYVAAQAFLDEKHEGPECVSPNDNNHYTLGKIGKHNVVIAVLPDGEYGTSSVAGAARDMLHSFPNIRVGLIVGIGGGAPSRKYDIRLGDVVVSAPRDGESGVFQYDFGKTIQNQSFQHTRFLNQSPTILRTAVNGLKAQYESEGHQLEATINAVLDKKPRLRKKYKRPDSSSDRLYQSRVIHPPNDQADCATVCGDDPLKLILRPERTEDEDNPAIHNGLIASANQLMKDASVRDKLAAEKDVLCFEMEAAGLVNHFPCLVIRGISDYSDSHKNKEWQGYSAMVAAAYAKDLLRHIPPNRLEAEKRIIDVIRSEFNEFHISNRETREAVENLGIEHKQDKINRWLQAPDISVNYHKALEQRHKGTGHWFLENKVFTEWKTQPNAFLWLHGIPGCGKTILSATIIEHLEKAILPSQSLLYFYFDSSDISKQSLDSMIRSLISQLYDRSDITRTSVDSLFSFCGDGRQQPRSESLCEVFLHSIKQVDKVWIILDALDECETRKGNQTGGLLSWMKGLLDSELKDVQLLVTSRPERDIQTALEVWVRKECIINIQSNLITDDIRAYIRTKVKRGDGLQRWQGFPEVQDEIENQLAAKANGM